MAAAGESVCAVVVTHNREEILRATLKAIGALDRPVDRIIVVDNASADGTAGMLAEGFPGVGHVRLPVNTGPAGGYAAGMRRAAADGHDWIWLFNDDDRPEPEALTVLLATAAEAAGRSGGERPAMVGCWQREADGTVHGSGYRWRHRHRPPPPAAEGGPPHPVDLLVFAGVLVDAGLVDRIGVPREEYFIMWEEAEFCLRARRAGRSILMVPRPLTASLHAGSGPGAAPWREYYQTRNQLAMALDHRSVPELWHWAVRTAKFCAAAAVGRRGRRAERIGLRLRGAWHGLRGVTGMTLPPPGTVRAGPRRTG